MKQFLLILSIFLSSNLSAQKKIEYKIGAVIPIPFFIYTNYLVHPSSLLLQVKYPITEKTNLTLTSGYLRFRASEPEYDVFSTVPIMVGGTYDISNSVYVGVNVGPSYIAESKSIEDKFRVVYSPYIGLQSNRWSIDLMYYNWEEVPDEINSLVISISYNF